MRAGALGVSALLHAIFLVFGFGAATGAIVSGGGGSQVGDVGVVNVSLEGSQGVAKAAAPPTDQLAFLYRQALSQQTELYANDQKQPQHESVQHLFDTIDAAAKAKGDPENRDQSTAVSSHGESRTVSAADHSRRGDHDALAQADGPGASASAGGLWGQIEPCWNDMPDVSRVPVTLDITIDDQGGIAVPPRIVRPNGSAPTEQRLISESRALAAIAACVPYRSLGGLAAKRRYLVQFAPSKPRGAAG